jgi:FkbM family methyltransferase
MFINKILYRIILSRQKKFKVNKERPRVVFLDDIITTSFFLETNYELRELRKMEFVIKTLLKNSAELVFLDIGANIGNHSLYLNKYFKQTVSFEPNPVVYSVLKLNTMSTSSIVTVNFGLSSENRTAVLRFDNSNIGGGSISSRTHEEFTEQEIILKKLDDILPSFVDGTVGFLKIDVEGHEGDVILGATETIKTCQPIIAFELLAEDSGNQTKLLNVLTELNYNLFEVCQKLQLLTKQEKGFMIKPVTIRANVDYPFILALPASLSK